MPSDTTSQSDDPIETQSIRRSDKYPTRRSVRMANM
ncbi:unnamed protein product [Brassica oleracea var. botrytis]